LEGFDLKKNCVALMVLLIIAGITLTNFAVGDEPVVLSGHRPTFTPNTNYVPPDPIDIGTLGTIRGQAPAQLSGGNAQARELSSVQVQEEFRIVGVSNEPIPNAQFKGYDGSGNNFQEFTDSNGYVAINGTPGDWQFTAYASGYFSNTWNRKYADNTYEVLTLQKMGSQQPSPNENRPESESAPIKTIVLDGCDFNKTVEQSSDPTTDQSNYLGDEG
jgi:hypothetical protein